MKNKSIWQQEQQTKISPFLAKDIEVDVLIIGGGITGISTAYQLKNANLKVCLVEKNEIGSGVTSRTTGKLTFLQENIYSKLKKYRGKDIAKLYLESQKEAIDIVENIVEKEKIDCNLEKVKSYVFTNSKEEKLDEEISVLKELNVDIKEENILPTGKKIDKAYYSSDTYVFHPLKYVFQLKEICLKEQVSIYENTKIETIKKEEDIYVCKTEKNTIKSKIVVLAMHYPFFLMPFWTPLKTHIEKSYIASFKVDKNYKFSAINISKPTISVRYHTDDNINYQLYLTNSHNTAIGDNDLKNFRQMLERKKIRPDYIWSNKDIITNDYLPYIGSLNSSNTFLIATGYNTWGMTNSAIASKVIKDIILKNENKYIKLFNPLRSINTLKLINFPIDLASNIYSFIKSKVIKQKPWYNKNVKFEKRNGKNIAIYIDENNKEHIVYNLCPHLKCSLNFNELEKTWDCPCHGSRFDIDGKCIEGPSNYDITYKE